ncbi:thioredoxin fold domain-containing protein [Maritimibacter sp. DP1N21-5]|uniref:thioredoxin fold domain-containing protein n=1 Tax=Maritimibacter sp. DP1N21-5 TaxID=2836867 RepID=UPI001C472DF3|nr:thioredoxin fold domain-containing protein [Maritimibacter sp. DP1N21-5]MBV7409588.1 thioredoxin family protein [Maritimibacter sp. DP1N21-5]
MRHFLAALAMVVALPLPALAAELVMVEQPGCAYCRAWNKDVSEEYPKTAEGRAAPLVRVQKDDIATSGITLARPVNFTPTFILTEDGRELARIEGYPGEDFFWGLLGMMLKAQDIPVGDPAEAVLDG